MMETSWAEVVQVYQYSSFKLLHTLPLPKSDPTVNPGNEISRATGFGPRVLDDGSVFLNTYECSFYHLDDVESETPDLKLVHTLQSDSSGPTPDHCGIPIRVNQKQRRGFGYFEPAQPEGSVSTGNSRRLQTPLVGQRPTFKQACPRR